MNREMIACGLGLFSSVFVLAVPVSADESSAVSAPEKTSFDPQWDQLRNDNQKMLSRDQANKLSQQILSIKTNREKELRKKEFESKAITLGGKVLKYQYRTLGEKPEGGHSLYISMHGGGGAPARVNDQQWSNQVKLYTPKEGIMLAPRAPTDTWDLWHLAHIDRMFDRLIDNFILFADINPNKVYIVGYSAGGDGVYQLAPRMADRWAGAGMMAGHPGDAQTYNLLNLPYIIQCGGKDAAYKRNQWCEAWGKKLDQLAKAEPGAYPHKWIVYPQYGHWMNRECQQAIPWLANHTRNPWPKKVQWYQDNVTQERFYWLANPAPKARQMLTAEVVGQTITLSLPKSDELLDPPVLETEKVDQGKPFEPMDSVTLRLSDALLDLDQAVTVKSGAGEVLFQGKVKRSVDAMIRSVEQRLDATSIATAELSVKLR